MTPRGACDVAVVGLGPAGRALAHRSLAAATLAFADTFSPALKPILVIAAWIVGSIVIAKTHFRWEPRA